MPPDRSDVKILVFATGAVVLAGVLVAAVLLLATGRSSGPTKAAPFSAGLAAAVKRDLKDGGPYLYPDPFGGDRNILLALEDGHIVALSNILPNSKSCIVEWKGSADSFVDCHGDKLTSQELNRYPTDVGQTGNTKGLLRIDIRKLEPAPQPS